MLRNFAGILESAFSSCFEQLNSLFHLGGFSAGRVGSDKRESYECKHTINRHYESPVKVRFDEASLELVVPRGPIFLPTAYTFATYKKVIISMTILGKFNSRAGVK